MPDSAQVPHFEVPFKFNKGSAKVVEQDSLDDYEQRVEAVMRTQRGSRMELLEYGIDDPAFKENGPNVDALRRVVSRWEPDATTQLTVDNPNALGVLAYRLKAETYGKPDA